MLPDFTNPADWLPWAFASLMGFSILIYVILDGFDSGRRHPLSAGGGRGTGPMIGSIGPFWDANETWLVMAVGLLLVAFPSAHGAILTALYLPVFIMLIGLILRGVAFEFRAKARDHHHKVLWNRAFFAGSLMTALAQGFMLGIYIMGLEQTWTTYAFASLTAVFLAVGYSFIGSTWLIHKTEGALQLKSVQWAKESLWGVILGIGAVSLATPLVSPRLFEKWLVGARDLLPRAAADHLRPSDPVALADGAADALPAGPAQLVALRGHDNTLRARISGHGLQLLPLRGARTADDL
jgi:cytochrome d ubiquinol oxidase subunit II